MPEVPTDWKQRYGPWIMRLVVALAAAGIGYVANWLGIPPPRVEFVEIEKPVLVAAAGDVGPAESFGWVRDPAVIADNFNPAWTDQFDATPAGRAILGDEDVYLWQAVRKVMNRGIDWYPNINQGPVGSCVGAGNKHGCDVVQATQILSGRGAEWKPVSAEVIYGGSRVEIGGGRIRGDGSVGRWAADWLTGYGFAGMEKYASADLTTYSANRAREFGRTGVPDDIEAVAKKHPVRGAALVKTWIDVKRAIPQGYPVVVCSDQGFRMERDSTGTCKPSGVWNHCMVVIAVRTKNGREQGFILNSWGDTAHTGPVDPPDAPKAGFWADAEVIDRMVRQGDSFALSDAVGFPQRLPDWFLAIPRDRDRLAIRDLRPLFALAP